MELRSDSVISRRPVFGTPTGQLAPSHARRRRRPVKPSLRPPGRIGGFCAHISCRWCVLRGFHPCGLAAIAMSTTNLLETPRAPSKQVWSMKPGQYPTSHVHSANSAEKSLPVVDYVQVNPWVVWKYKPKDLKQPLIWGKRWCCD